GPVELSDKTGKREGDIDLFVFDRKNKVALCCQLKWFLIPDRFRNSNIEKVWEGVEQALHATEWLVLDADRVQATMGIKRRDYQNVEVLPLVRSRDWMLNGIKWSEDVPIVSEDLFDYLLDSAPEHDRLRAVWECLSQRTYLPIPNEDFYVRQ